MKKIIFPALLALCICFPVLSAAEDIAAIFGSFIKAHPGGFTMIPAGGDSLLLDRDGYAVLIDKNNFYIRITDSRLRSGDGTLSSAFTLFTRKGRSDIVAITHTMSGGDSGGNEPDNRLSFYNVSSGWEQISNEQVMPAISFSDFWGQGDLPPEKFRKLKFRYVLPRVGTDFIVFALEDPSFRKYDADQISYTLNPDYLSFFTRMKNIGIILKWDSAKGSFSKKGSIANTEENRDSRFIRKE